MKSFPFVAALLCSATVAQAQEVPPGPEIHVTMVTQLSPTIPQYLRVDIPRLREGIPQRSGGRIKVTLASWPERNLTGPELLRVLRAGQIDLGGIALPTVAGDVPLLDVIDLAGLLTSHEQGRRVAEAMIPEINRELERVGVRIIATYPFPAQVFFCREPIASLADLKGKRVRTPGGSQNDFIQAIGAQPVAIGFPEVYGALERGVVDCAVTGTATGNGARWFEVTRHLYTLPVQWGVAAYGVNLSWWNKLDPTSRPQASFRRSRARRLRRRRPWAPLRCPSSKARATSRGWCSARSQPAGHSATRSPPDHLHHLRADDRDLGWRPLPRGGWPEHRRCCALRGGHSSQGALIGARRSRCAAYAVAR